MPRCSPVPEPICLEHQNWNASAIPSDINAARAWLIYN